MRLEAHQLPIGEEFKRFGSRKRSGEQMLPPERHGFCPVDQVEIRFQTEVLRMETGGFLRMDQPSFPSGAMSILGRIDQSLITTLEAIRGVRELRIRREHRGLGSFREVAGLRTGSRCIL